MNVLFSIAFVTATALTISSVSAAELRIRATIPGNVDARATCVAISIDGRLLATGSEDNGVRLWDVATMSLIANLTNHGDPVRAMTFSPDGRLLVSSSLDGMVLIWDLKSRKVTQQVKRPGSVMGLGFSKDGKTLAIETQQLSLTQMVHSIIKWDLNSQSGKSLELVGKNFGFGSQLCAISSNAAACSDGKGEVTVYDLPKMKKRSQFRTLPNGFKTLGDLHAVRAIAISPSGDVAYTCGRKVPSFTAIWNQGTRSADEISLPPGRQGESVAVSAIAFAPSGKWMILGGRGVYIWDLEQERFSSTWPKSTELPKNDVCHFAIFPNEREIALVRNDGIIQILEVVRSKNSIGSGDP